MIGVGEVRGEVGRGGKGKKKKEEDSNENRMRPPAFARPVWRRLESVHTDDRADDKISGSAMVLEKRE